MIKGCIFDLDGVIVDTAKYHYIAWKALANELGFDFTESDNERLKGVSRMRSLDILLEIGGIELGEDKKHELADRKNKIYLEYIYKMTPNEILPGAETFIKELKSNKIKIALGSASKNATFILDKLHLTPLFDVIVDGNMVANAKPDPEVFVKGADLIGISPNECVVFEDAESGVEAAIIGGMKCIGIGDLSILKNAHAVIPGLTGFDLNTLVKILEN
jgi:beta-phosphoglucomutase